MKIHESPEIPKSRRQQASILENLHNPNFSPKESAHEITPAWLTIPQSLPDFVIHSDSFFSFSSFGVGDRTQGLICALSTHNTPKSINQFRQLVKKNPSKLNSDDLGCLRESVARQQC